MIDAEPAIYNELITRLQAKYKWAKSGKVGFSNEWVRQPEKFPWVTFTEEDNRTEIKFHDSGSEENAVRLTYQCDVWTNDNTTRKKTARTIMKAVDDELLAMGFRRTYLNNDAESGDASIYRCIGRYSAIVDEYEGTFWIHHRP